MLSIPEVRSALDADRSVHGIYAWWLCDAAALPGVPTTPHPTEPIGLIYVGIGPGRPGSKRALRARFGDHSRDTGRSTLRRTLASFLFEHGGWHPYFTDRPLLTTADNDALSAWMNSNLRVQWVRADEPWLVEAEVVRAMRPPLNRSHNDAHPFYKAVGDARTRFRAAAIGGTDP